MHVTPSRLRGGRAFHWFCLEVSKTLLDDGIGGLLLATHLVTGGNESGEVPISDPNHLIHEGSQSKEHLHQNS
jgi:hypothetical protein